MKLIRVLLVAGLSFMSVSAKTIHSQTAQSPQANIQPFATLSFGPGIGQGAANERGNKSAAIHPVSEFTIGARKRLARKFGVVISANVGKLHDRSLIGDDLSCRLQIVDGTYSGCLPNDPLLNWYGAAAGGVGYFGRAIVGLQFGPASFGTRAYERDPLTGEKHSREVGLRSQLDVHVPVHRRLDVTLSAVRGYVPKIVSDRMKVTSMSAGLSLRPFR